MVAKVKTNECVGCGICVDECPSGVIELEDETAKIDEEKCTDCGTCIDACPNQAISSD